MLFLRSAAEALKGKPGRCLAVVVDDHEVIKAAQRKRVTAMSLTYGSGALGVAMPCRKDGVIPENTYFFISTAPLGFAISTQPLCGLARAACWDARPR